jgi:hypothetical protein
MHQVYGRSLFLIGLMILVVSQCRTQWIQTNGVTGGSVNAMAVCGTDIYAGTDSVFHSTDNGTSWVSISPPYLILALTAGHNGDGGTSIFVGTLSAVVRSTDNGANWTPVLSSQNTFFDAIVISGPNVFAGSDIGVFHSTDYGSSWNNAGSGLQGWVTALAVGATWTGDTNLFASTNYGIYLSTNNGSNWTHMTSLPAMSQVNTLIVKGTKIFAGKNHGIFLSTDNGADWSADNNGLTDTLINAFAVSGKNIFAGTDGGVFLSSDNGTSWSAMNNGLTDTIVYSLAARDSFLFAGTGSHNVWRRPLSEVIPKVTCGFAVSNGWNLISVPVMVDDFLKTTLFPSALSEAFAYQGSYLQEDTLSLGAGYWLRFDHNQTVSMSGDFVAPESVAVAKGWNIIGSVGDSVPVSIITSSIPGMITGRFFGYQNGYIVADSILPGYGYWVKVDTGGYLFLNSNQTSPITNRIHIVATDELPPSPPDGKNDNLIPKQYTLEQAFPSPFNPTTTIQYSLPENSTVKITVYNLIGQAVAILQDGVVDAGYRQVSWNAGNLASGIYFYRLEAAPVMDPTRSFAQVKKVVLMK